MMKKNEITIGGIYSAKVSGNLVPVRIDAENAHGGWDGTNLKTKRPVHIKSARRLRGKTRARPGGKRIMTKAEYEADAKREAGQEAKPTKQRHTGERGAASGKSVADGSKPMSLLDAAAHLLSLGTGDPMRCQAIVDLAINRNLWTPRTGKTPANTLYAAIAREIKDKGSASRFVKAERGKFALKR